MDIPVMYVINLIMVLKEMCGIMWRAFTLQILSLTIASSVTKYAIHAKHFNSINHKNIKVENEIFTALLMVFR